MKYVNQSIIIFCLIQTLSACSLHASQEVRSPKLAALGILTRKSSAPNSPRIKKSKSLDDCRVKFSEFAEPKAQDDDGSQEIVTFFDLHALLEHIERSVTFFPEGTIQDPSLITPELMGKDLGDVTGSVTYDDLKNSVLKVTENSQLVYKALVAQSVRKKVRKCFLLQQALEELRGKTKKLLPFLVIPELKQHADALERVSKALDRMGSSDLTEEEVRNVEKKLLDEQIKPFDKFLRDLCILKPCK